MSSSSNEYLIEEESIIVNKNKFDGVGAIAALDRGCTLTKVLYSTEHDDENYKLHFALFRNSHFEAALDFLRSRGFVQLQEGAKLHVTGAGCDMYRHVIQQKFNIQIEFIDEFLTQTRGTHWLLKSAPDTELCYPNPQLKDSEINCLKDNEMIRVFTDVWRREIGEWDRDAKFPCLVLFVGSGAGILKIEENGESNMIGGMWMAGRTFLGMSKLLLGTDNYDEIMEMAASGDRCKVDSQVKELLANDPKSPYGRFPKEMPIFSFGKVMDQNLSLGDYSREDLASALVSMFAINAFNSVLTVAGTTKVPRIYLGGNFFRGKEMRTEIIRQVAMFGGLDSSLMSVKFLKTGHTGAIGAMASKPEDLQKYMMYLKQQHQQQQQ